MVGKITVRKKKKFIDASQPDPSKLKFAKVLGRERGEVEAISARSELHRRGLVSAKEAEEGFEIKGGKLVKKETEEETTIKQDLIKARETIGRIEEAERPDLIKITMIDELGVEKTLEITPEEAALLNRGKINEGLQARSEGRVPFNELPVYQQILAETAILGVSPKALTTVGKLGQIGKKGVPATIKTTADTFASNPKSSVQTMKWLGGLGASVAAAFLIKDMMGTYPMAGFLKEEALQTLSFAFKSAKDSGNIDGMASALDLQFEALNPSLWDKILFAIPYLNVHVQNKAFYEAAREKMKIDAKGFEKALEELEG